MTQNRSPLSLFSLLAPLAIVATLTACGPSPETDLAHLDGDCALPTRISAPHGRRISLDRLVDGVPGEYRATKVEYYFDGTHTMDSRRYLVLTESKVTWPDSGSTPSPTFKVRCQDGSDLTTATLEVWIPYAFDRASGELTQARDETLKLKGTKVKGHSSKPTHGKTMSHYANALRAGITIDLEMKVFQQSDTTFLVVTKATDRLTVVNQVTLYTAITYQLQ